MKEFEPFTYFSIEVVAPMREDKSAGFFVFIVFGFILLFALQIFVYLFSLAEPAESNSTQTPYYSVRCNDGSISLSGGKQGACSHHGGVQ